MTTPDAATVPHWKDWAVVSYLYETGKPPDNLPWDVAHAAFQRTIERAKAAEEAESNG